MQFVVTLNMILCYNQIKSRFFSIRCEYSIHIWDNLHIIRNIFAYAHPENVVRVNTICCLLFLSKSRTVQNVSTSSHSYDTYVQIKQITDWIFIFKAPPFIVYYYWSIAC